MCKNVLENISWPISCNFAPIYPSLSPFPHINVGYFDDPSSCNTEITLLNIDMGVGEGRSCSPYISEKLKNMVFPKIFAHDCRFEVLAVGSSPPLRLGLDQTVRADLKSSPVLIVGFEILLHYPGTLNFVSLHVVLQICSTSL